MEGRKAGGQVRLWDHLARELRPGLFPEDELQRGAVSGEHTQRVEPRQRSELSLEKSGM